MRSDPLAMTTGHRDAKKLRTREAILKNAIALFCDRGVQATRSAAIAEASQVSPATLFNYFPSRRVLAGAWVRGELVRVFQAGMHETEAGGLRRGLRRACRELARLALLDPEARLEAWRLASRASDPVVAELEARFAVRVAAEQQRGRIRSDLAAPEIASLLLAAAEDALIHALGSVVEVGALREEAVLASALQARVDLVLDGARKRNERVAAPRTGSIEDGGGSARMPAES